MKQRKTTLTFAGQAGFILESADGYRMGVDLYLSNCCERYFGFKRLMPYLYDPLDLKLDTVVATHAHYDHFDPDSVPLLLRNGKTELVCAHDVKIEVDKLGLDERNITYLAIGDVYKNEQVTIKAMPCDHGTLAPDALGLLITMDGKRIYITGGNCLTVGFQAVDIVIQFVENILSVIHKQFCPHLGIQPGHTGQILVAAGGKAFVI